MPIRFSCAAKVSYASREEAAEFARDRHGNSLVFQCPECGEWHLTSQNHRPRWLRGKVYRVAGGGKNAPTMTVLTGFGRALQSAIREKKNG